jgi:hypothetical protein
MKVGSTAEMAVAVPYRPFRFVSCTGRRLTDDHANVWDRGRGRATSYGGRHIASCDRSECSVDRAGSLGGRFPAALFLILNTKTEN